VTKIDNVLAQIEDVLVKTDYVYSRCWLNKTMWFLAIRCGEQNEYVVDQILCSGSNFMRGLNIMW
jgi:predicted nucleic acid-binding Zn finger protein